jgi:hypothetical protein
MNSIIYIALAGLVCAGGFAVLFFILAMCAVAAESDEVMNCLEE